MKISQIMHFIGYKNYTVYNDKEYNKKDNIEDVLFALENDDKQPTTEILDEAFDSAKAYFDSEKKQTEIIEKFKKNFPNINKCILTLFDEVYEMSAAIEYKTQYETSKKFMDLYKNIKKITKDIDINESIK